MLMLVLYESDISLKDHFSWTLNKFSPGESIMADKGIMTQDLFATQNVYVNTPSLLKGKKSA